MKPLGRDEILALEDYEAARPAFRDAVIALKRNRRLGVGDCVTLVFENRETLRFQVQEMLRVERLRDPARVQEELDVYNELMPAAGELSATLFIEITELARIQPELDRLVGIDEHVALVLGEDEAERSLRARFDPKQFEEDRISAVQYLRFTLDAQARAALADPGQRARLRIDHPSYQHEAELSPPLRASLLADLSGRDPEPLLRAPGRREAAAPAGEVLFATTNVRALRPERPRAPGHVVVEPIAPCASLLEAEPALLLELLAAVKRASAEIVSRFGRCRIWTEVGVPGAAGERLRWHLGAPEN